MSTDLDRRLRAALHDVADVPAPEFAPAAALAGARRRRRRRATALVAGVAAVAAAAIAVPTVALRSGPAQPAAPRRALSRRRVRLRPPSDRDEVRPG
jgi:hypothetical protein